MTKLKFRKAKKRVTTLMLYDACGDSQPVFYVFDGDYRHLNGVYINESEDEEKVTELAALIENVVGYELNTPTKDWD